jgi:hypothetical protein
MRKVFAIGLSTVVATSAALADRAMSPWLQGDELRAVLSGKTLEGRYAGGRAFTERYGADGSLWYAEGARKIYGHWSITAGTLCTIYDTDPTGGCFRVSRVGDNCFEFYFAARTEAAAPESSDRDPEWTARGAVSDKPEACRDNASA